jgi:epoxyqueuosine reductase
MAHDLTVRIKTTAKAAGADLVGVASIDRFDHASRDVHPRSIFGHTQSVIAVGCRMVRGALKAVEEGHYWQAYNCDSYQYLNEVLAPHLLRRIVLLLEDRGCTAVPIHNPFCAHVGRPVYSGGPNPDSIISLRVVGCAAGLGEWGLSKLFLTPQSGPRQRMYAVLTDAVLEPDPLFTASVCDECGACIRSCPAEAMSPERTVEVRIGDHVFRHGALDLERCVEVHQGWDPHYSPFLGKDSSRDNAPPYYQFLDRRFRHRAICVGRGCVRACVDHLEKTGRIERQYRVPMIEGEQWVIEEPLE